MDKSTYTPVYYSDCELSMKSVEDLAIEQIQQEDDNEQTLIQSIQQDIFEMNNKNIDDSIETIVNNELRCDICKSIPCAMIIKHNAVKEMVDNLSKKWDITRSAGNNSIREKVFTYLENDQEVPMINGHIPDCVLSGVLDLIPDPVSSFPAINIAIKTSGERKYDNKDNENGNEELMNKNTTKIANNDNLRGVNNTIASKYKSKHPQFQNPNKNENDNEENATSTVMAKKMKHNTTVTNDRNGENLNNVVNNENNTNNTIQSITEDIHSPQNYNSTSNNNNNSDDNSIYYNENETKYYERNENMTATVNNEEDEMNVKDDQEKNDVQLLKENVQDIFDQLTNLELLLQSLHDKIDTISEHIL